MQRGCDSPLSAFITPGRKFFNISMMFPPEQELLWTDRSIYPNHNVFSVVHYCYTEHDGVPCTAVHRGRRQDHRSSDPEAVHLSGRCGRTMRHLLLVSQFYIRTSAFAANSRTWACACVL